MPVLKFLAVVALLFVAVDEARAIEPPPPPSMAETEERDEVARGRISFSQWEEIKKKYQIDKTVREMAKEERHVARGQLIVIDTRDQDACRKVHDSLTRLPSLATPAPRLEEFCRLDAQRPVVTFTILQDLGEFTTPLNLDPLRSTEKNLANDTRNLAYSMGAAMGILWLMPESVTKWDKDKIRNGDKEIFAEYAENVRRGPVVDKDDWAVNYIGHPVSGAAYYTLARHNGMSRWQSFGYSVAMSTFFWEYGFEAFAEVPSIQDLILTPTMGAIIGEAFYSMDQSIRANNGKLLGSERLGRTALVILNPMGAMSSSINKALGTEVIQKAGAELVLKRPEAMPAVPAPLQGAPDNSGFLGIRLKFAF